MGLKTKRACVLGGGRRLFFRVDKLESKSTAELPPPAQQLSGSLTEVGIQWVYIHVLQIGSIENVVELEPNLEVESFLEPVVFEDGEIRLCKVRPAERVLLLVPFGADGRLRKLPGRKDTAQE